MNQNEIKDLGASLSRIDEKLLKNDKKHAKRIWYQGEESYFDIFLDFEGSELIWLQVTFRGRCLWWSLKQPQIQTGITNELMLNDVSYYSASKLIEKNPIPDREFIQLVRSILQTRAGEPVFDKALEILQ